MAKSPLKEKDFEPTDGYKDFGLSLEPISAGHRRAQ